MNRLHFTLEHIGSPLRVARGLAELALMIARRGDDALYDFPDTLPYNETNYPPCGAVDGPYATEDELLA